MTQEPSDLRRSAAIEAYRDETFLNSREARSLRILSEYLEPKSRFEHYQIEDTIVFMGSARVISGEQAEKALKTVQQDEPRAFSPLKRGKGRLSAKI